MPIVAKCDSLDQYTVGITTCDQDCDSADPSFIAPWPCWMLAASPSANEDEVKQFLAALGEYTTSFDSKEKRETENVAYVAKTFNQQESDVKEWLSTVAWYHDLAKVESKVVIDTLQ
jgi:hypothetical protein